MTCESCLLVRSWGDTTQKLILPKLTLLSEFTMWCFCLNFPWLEELHKDRLSFMRSEPLMSPFVSRIYPHCNFFEIEILVYIPTYYRSFTPCIEYNCLWPRICSNGLKLRGKIRVGNLHLTSCLNLNPCEVVDTYHLKSSIHSTCELAPDQNIWHH